MPGNLQHESAAFEEVDLRSFERECLMLEKALTILLKYV